MTEASPSIEVPLPHSPRTGYGTHLAAHAGGLFIFKSLHGVSDVWWSCFRSFDNLTLSGLLYPLRVHINIVSSSEAWLIIITDENC